MSYKDELIQVAAVAVAALQCDIDGDTRALLTRENMLDAVRDERAKQEAKWGAQKHSREKWLAILMEEVGEAAKAVLEEQA